MGKTVLTVTLVGQNPLLDELKYNGVMKRVDKDFPEDSFNQAILMPRQEEIIYLATGIHWNIDWTILWLNKLILYSLQRFIICS